VRRAVGPFLSSSSAFVACGISYNRLGFWRKPYRAFAPDLSVLFGYPAGDSVNLRIDTDVKIKREILVLLRNQKVQNENFIKLISEIKNKKIRMGSIEIPID
jgi:hypothetical protein